VLHGHRREAARRPGQQDVDRNKRAAVIREGVAESCPEASKGRTTREVSAPITYEGPAVVRRRVCFVLQWGAAQVSRQHVAVLRGSASVGMSSLDDVDRRPLR
jgi:hypothetical protein